MKQIVTKDKVEEQLRTIIDPELNINIVDLGLIYGIAIQNDVGEVVITMTLTTPGCPLSFVFEEWIPAALKKIKGVKRVTIDLVWEPPWDPNKMSDDVREEMGIIR